MAPLRSSTLSTNSPKAQLGQSVRVKRKCPVTTNVNRPLVSMVKAAAASNAVDI
jgi:hypothetical protein